MPKLSIGRVIIASPKSSLFEDCAALFAHYGFIPKEERTMVAQDLPSRVSRRQSQTTRTANRFLRVWTLFTHVDDEYNVRWTIINSQRIHKTRPTTIGLPLPSVGTQSNHPDAHSARSKLNKGCVWEGGGMNDIRHTRINPRPSGYRFLSSFSRCSRYVESALSRVVDGEINFRLRCRVDLPTSKKRKQRHEIARGCLAKGLTPR